MSDETDENEANIGNAGKGRPKGSPNKISRLLREAIIQAASEAGADNVDDPEGLVKYLKVQAKESPGPFLGLLGKVLPMTVNGKLETTQRNYVVRMPLPCKDAEEWLRIYGPKREGETKDEAPKKNGMLQ